MTEASAPPVPFGDERAAPAAPSGQVAPPAPAGAERQRAAPAAAEADAARPATPAATDDRAAARAETAGAATRDALAGKVAKAAGPAAAPLAEALASIASQPQRWSWRRDGGARGAMTPALETWLRRLDAATAGHWRGVAESGAAEPDAAALLGLDRDGVAAWTVRIYGGDAGGVRLTPAGAATPALQAALPADVVDTLKRELTAAAR